MDRGIIQRVGRTVDPEEARTLLEGLFSEPGHLQQLPTVLESAVGAAVIHYGLGKGRAYS